MAIDINSRVVQSNPIQSVVKFAYASVGARVLNLLSFLKQFVTTKYRMSFKGGPGQKVQKVMVQPINLIFRYLQNRARIQVWLYENNILRIEGHIIGFDEYMNLVLDDAEEIYTKTKQRKQVGRILLKGENITLIMSTQAM